MINNEQSSILSPNNIDEILSRKLYEQLKLTSRLEKGSEKYFIDFLMKKIFFLFLFIEQNLNKNSESYGNSPSASIYNLSPIHII